MHIHTAQRTPTATSRMGQMINRQLERAIRPTNIDGHTEIAGVFEAPSLCFSRHSVTTSTPEAAEVASVHGGTTRHVP
jgi:hypothetical protein